MASQGDLRAIPDAILLRPVKTYARYAKDFDERGTSPKAHLNPFLYVVLLFILGASMRSLQLVPLFLPHLFLPINSLWLLLLAQTIYLKIP